jgi:glycosyltransferase involved in cell wall biosynthesis
MKHLVVASPLPPSWSGIATYTANLLPHWTRQWRVTVVLADGEPTPTDLPDAVDVIHASSWHWFRRVATVDRIIWALGNSEFHLHVPALVRAHGGVVLAHDVRMTGLHCLLAQRASDPHWLSTRVRDHHGPALGDEIRAIEGDGPFTPVFSAARTRLEQANVFLLKEAVQGADAVVVHSHLAARLARLDIGPPIPVHVTPFGHPAVRPRARPNNAVVASFGFVATEKHAMLLTEAMAAVRQRVPQAELRFVGHADPAVAAAIGAEAARLGLPGAVTITGRLDNDEYQRQLGETAVAVQLRAIVNGEASAAVSDCLAAGVPTIVSDHGAQGELPTDAVIKIPSSGTTTLVSDEIVRALTDRGHWEDLTNGAQRFAAQCSFAAAAEALSRILSDTPPPRL